MSFFSLHHFIELIHAYGNVVVGVVVALESIGLPLPGESLLIAAAVVAGTTHDLNIVFVILFAALGAISGQMAGYWIGRSVGIGLLKRYGHYIGLTEQRLAYGRNLFQRHGVVVIFAARFIVFLRTLAALLAGANHMPWGRFMVANVAGSAVWSVFYGGGAYLLGHEAKQMAAPVAIGIGVAVVAALVAAGVYARRRERQLVSQPVRSDSTG